MTEWVLAPREPVEDQWGALARDIVMWWSFSPPTGDALHRHLKRLGRDIPAWLPDLIGDRMYVPPKGAVAAAIYRAMIDAAPLPPNDTMTPDEARAGQQWAGMDGAIAWHLIERHADGWGEVGTMMNAWLGANRAAPQMTDADMDDAIKRDEAEQERAHVAYLRGVAEGKRQAAAPQQAEPAAQIGWADEFGNLFPMGAWKPTQRTHHDSHKAAWRPVFLHPPADEVRRLRDALDEIESETQDVSIQQIARKALEGK